jgi:hypothetical protein
MNEVEFKRTIARFLIRQPSSSVNHQTLIRLRAVSKEWFSVVNRTLRLQYGNRLLARRTLIPWRSCMCCKESHPNENDVHEMITNLGNSIVFCRDRISCKVAALFVALDELLILGGRFFHFKEKRVVKVKRSSGAIEDDWILKNLVWFTEKKTIYVGTELKRMNLSRTTRLDEFVALNPEITETVIQVIRTSFHDQTFHENLCVILRSCGIQFVFDTSFPVFIAKE